MKPVALIFIVTHMNPVDSYKCQKELEYSALLDSPEIIPRTQ